MEAAPRKLHHRILDLIFPPRCIGCARPGAWICRTCWPKVPWIASTDCISCPSPQAAGGFCSACLGISSGAAEARSIDMLAVTRHTGIARQAVHELKYTGHHDIATVLGPLMAECVSTRNATVIPVPLHWSRRRARGYNQSALLATQISRALDLPRDAKGLRRVSKTRDQIDLNPLERRANVAKAFRWEGGAIATPVLLVDDVYTTGATMNACADALRAAGCRTVEGIVFACAPSPMPVATTLAITESTIGATTS